MRHALLHVVWTEMCVGSVCTQPPYNDKDPPSVFYLFKSFTLSQIEPISDACKCDVTQTEAPPTNVWLTADRLDWCFSSDPPWVSGHHSAIVSIPEKEYTRISPKRLRCFVAGCNNEHSSRHLLPTSEPLKTQWLHLFLKRIYPIYLNALMFARIIRDPASPPEEVSVRFHNTFLKIVLPNNMLVSKFWG